jgi:hypothetical protein
VLFHMFTIATCFRPTPPRVQETIEQRLPQQQFEVLKAAEESERRGSAPFSCLSAL